MTPPHVIWTMRALARRLGVAEEETVVGYAMRPRDPLRVRYILGKHWMKAERVDRWRARQEPGNTCPRIVGLAAMAKKLRCSINTVKAYATRERDPLPVHGLGGRHPWVYEDALVDWFDAQDKPAVSVWLTDRLAG